MLAAAPSDPELPDSAVDVDVDELDPGPGETRYPQLTAVDEHGLSRLWETAPPARPDPRDHVGQAREVVGDRAASLIAADAGRRRLARELAITEHEARGLLARTRTTHTPGATP